MIKNMCISLLIIMLSVSGAVCAGSTAYQRINYDGNGEPIYPNNGSTYVYAMRDRTVTGSSSITSWMYATDGHPVYYKFSGSVYAYAGASPNYYSATIDITPMGSSAATCAISGGTCSDSFSAEYDDDTGSYKIYAYATSVYDQYECHAQGIMYVKTIPFLDLTVSGSTCGVSTVALAIWTGSGYDSLNNSDLDIEGDSYNYDVVEDNSYRLTFSDGHYYDFSPTTTNINYDRDVCAYYKLNLLDNCANPLINPFTTIFRNTDELIYSGYDNPISLLIGSDVELNDFLDIIIWTCDGNILFHDYVIEIEKDLYHQDISWFLNVHVIDDSTGADIPLAKVVRSQDCCIFGELSGYALTQTDGHVEFIGLANSNIGLTVEKSGYNTYSQTVNIGSCFNCQSEGATITINMNATTGESTEEFNNGTHNDSENVDGSGGEILPENNVWGCGVYFKNADGYIVNTIYDTDPYVDMYYWVKGGDATLKFQNQMYTYWYTCEEYVVTNNTYEYRRILNSNFSDHTDSYRGYIYNETSGCNDIQILHVINQTHEEETDYNNLTSHCQFRYKMSGNQIDYRSDVEIMIYANSDNSTLLTINAYLMNGSDVVDSTAFNWADFVNGVPKWWVVWNPDYEYTTGYNYTVNITGFNDYQLDTDEVWTSNIVGNTLTINVKDNHNTPIQYATVFIEGWGSQAIGTSTYASITGLPDGNIQYKATKSSYTSSGWNNIDLSGSDETVECVLIQQSSDSVTGYKLKDKEIKAFFIPLIYLLLIMMIIGGLMNAAKK